jgi:hypothetical protein
LLFFGSIRKYNLVANELLFTHTRLQLKAVLLITDELLRVVDQLQRSCVSSFLRDISTVAYFDFT